MAGVKFKGEAQPEPDDAEWQAITAWKLLSNGSGGFDMGAGLDTVVELLGVTDVEGLIHRLVLIKLHRRPDADNPELRN